MTNMQEFSLNMIADYTTIWGRILFLWKNLILLFIKDTFNLSKMTLNTFVMLQKILF